MDFLQVLEQYGVPIAVAIAFGFFIWKQNKYIQDDLSKDMHQKFNRIEGILIKLIDQQKKNQIELRGLERSLDTLVRLWESGFNAIKYKFMSMFSDKNK